MISKVAADGNEATENNDWCSQNPLEILGVKRWLRMLALFEFDVTQSVVLKKS